MRFIFDLELSNTCNLRYISLLFDGHLPVTIPFQFLLELHFVCSCRSLSLLASPSLYSNTM